jgi:hypothetical protein
MSAELVSAAQDFHRRYYHPSNARFWFYGDDDPVERLRILYLPSTPRSPLYFITPHLMK